MKEIEQECYDAFKQEFPAVRLDDMLLWISENLYPEHIFLDHELIEWAEDNIKFYTKL